MGNSYVAAGGDDEGICVNYGTTALRSISSSAWTQWEAQITDA